MQLQATVLKFFQGFKFILEQCLQHPIGEQPTLNGQIYMRECLFRQWQTLAKLPCFYHALSARLYIRATSNSKPFTLILYWQSSLCAHHWEWMSFNRNQSSRLQRYQPQWSFANKVHAIWSKARATQELCVSGKRTTKTGFVIQLLIMTQSNPLLRMGTSMV